MSDSNIHPIFDRLVTRQERELYLNQHASVFWLTGLSGSGKSTIAVGAERELFNKGFYCQVLDGDNIRTGISNNLGFSSGDREENIRRIAEVAKLFTRAGIITICSFISPLSSIRELAKSVVGKDDFFEIFVQTDLETCEERDVKGLYKKARAGIIKDFTGIDAPYETPKNPDLILDTSEASVEESVMELCEFIQSKTQKK